MPGDFPYFLPDLAERSFRNTKLRGPVVAGLLITTEAGDCRETGEEKETWPQCRLAKSSNRKLGVFRKKARAFITRPFPLFVAKSMFSSDLVAKRPPDPS